jgi:hypothetical protein
MNTTSEQTPCQRQPSVEKAAFLVTEIGFLSALAVWGGPAWVGVVVPAIFIEIYCGSQLRSLGMLMPAGIWLVLCTLTGNRELFFPLCHVRHGIHGDSTMGEEPKYRNHWGAFRWSIVSLHSVAPKCDHGCASC